MYELDHVQSVCFLIIWRYVKLLRHALNEYNVALPDINGQSRALPLRSFSLIVIFLKKALVQIETTTASNLILYPV